MARQVNDTQKIARNRIHGAPYNPRQLNPLAQAKIRDGMKKFGLVGAPVVNRRLPSNGWAPEDTEGFFIVSGHQRLKVMDGLKKGKGYEVECTVVTLTPTEEKELNVLLNNAQAQGQWDFSRLRDLLHTPDLDIEVTGFDPMSLELLFPEDTEFAGMFSSKAASAEERKVAGETAALSEAAIIEEMKERKRAHAEKDNASLVLGGACIAFSFAEPEHAAAVAEKLNLEPGKREVWFYPGGVLEALLGLHDNGEEPTIDGEPSKETED